MHETERRRSILATVDASRFTAFEELGRQEEGSAATIRQIAAEDGLHRQVMRYAPPLAKDIAQTVSSVSKIIWRGTGKRCCE